MNFNSHYDLIGKHATLSASKYHWINYDSEKMAATYRSSMDAAKGTELHEIASALIKNRIKLPRSQKTLNMYVNDAIGYRMKPEQILYYSNNAFGTADAISFRKNHLRIHDLKNGVTKTSMHQLEVYTAFFCLEYGFKPGELEVELRIYQNDFVQVYHPEPDPIVRIMDKIVDFDKLIDNLRLEAML